MAPTKHDVNGVYINQASNGHVLAVCPRCGETVSRGEELEVAQAKARDHVCHQRESGTGWPDEHPGE